MVKLVNVNKIFPFTKEEIKVIKNIFNTKEPFKELLFSYSLLPDKEKDIYTKDDCNTKLAFISYIGNIYNFRWMFLERGINIDLEYYGFCDNASQAIHYAEENIKDNYEHCIVLEPFKPNNDMDEKFCYGNGPYIGVLKKPHYENTLYGVEIPKNMEVMFHFYIFKQNKIKIGENDV